MSMIPWLTAAATQREYLLMVTPFVGSVSAMEAAVSRRNFHFGNMEYHSDLRAVRKKSSPKSVKVKSIVESVFRSRLVANAS